MDNILIDKIASKIIGKIKRLWLSSKYAFARGYLSIKNINKKYEEVTVDAVLRQKTSDIITILGSGYSINFLSEKQWEFIKSHDSIGFNRWFYNDFIPTFYHIEHFRLTEDNIPAFNVYMKRWKEIKERYRDIIFFVSKSHVIKGCHPKYRPELFSDDPKIFVYPKLFKKHIPKERTIDIKDFHDFSKNLGDCVYIVRGSVTSIIHLCYQMGYKKIILAGIDLCDINGKRYFWYTDKYPEWMKVSDRPLLIYSSTKVGYHPTTNWADGRYHAVDTFIPALNQLVFKPEGREIFLMTKDSLLYPALRVYNEI